MTLTTPAAFSTRELWRHYGRRFPSFVRDTQVCENHSVMLIQYYCQYEHVTISVSSTLATYQCYREAYKF
jgi:hypothetical protein